MNRNQIDNLLREAECYLIAILREALSTPDYSGPSDPLIEATVKQRNRIVDLLVESGEGEKVRDAAKPKARDLPDAATSARERQGQGG